MSKNALLNLFFMLVPIVIFISTKVSFDKKTLFCSVLTHIDRHTHSLYEFFGQPDFQEGTFFSSTPTDVNDNGTIILMSPF